MAEQIKQGLGNLAENVAAKIPNPYYPLGVEIVGYLVNERSVPALLGIFFGGIAVIMAVTHIIATKLNPQLKGGEITTIMWFVISGTIHLFFEGYFSLNHAAMGHLQTLFGQLWKEYALSDSRYLTQDAFVLCMETITAFLWGPLCYVVAYMITSNHPLRHPFQIIVSHGQLYGVILYYATSLFDHYGLDKPYSRPEAYYYWGYYFFTNFFWAVIPTWLIYNSCVAIADAFRKVNKLQKTAAVNGKVDNGSVKKTM